MSARKIMVQGSMNRTHIKAMTKRGNLKRQDLLQLVEDAQTIADLKAVLSAVIQKS